MRLQGQEARSQKEAGCIMNVQPIAKKSGIRGGDSSEGGPGDHRRFSGDTPGRRGQQETHSRASSQLSPQPDKGHHTHLISQQRKCKPSLGEDNIRDFTIIHIQRAAFRELKCFVCNTTEPFDQKSRENKPIETDSHLMQVVKLSDKELEIVMSVFQEMI